MKVKLTLKLKRAFKKYYTNRKNCKKIKWDKMADLNNIKEALPYNCVYFKAIAGTFWLTWKNPRVQTTHNNKNYWTGKVLAKYDKRTKKYNFVSKYLL